MMLPFRWGVGSCSVPIGFTTLLFVAAFGSLVLFSFFEAGCAVEDAESNEEDAECWEQYLGHGKWSN